MLFLVTSQPLFGKHSVNPLFEHIMEYGEVKTDPNSDTDADPEYRKLNNGLTEYLSYLYNHWTLVQLSDKSKKDP